jgi:hypothetical protein
MSVEQGLILVMIVSLLCEVVVCLYYSRKFCFLMTMIIPFMLSTSLYWLPNLDHIHDGEFRMWFGLFFIVWFVPSAAACTVVATILTWLIRHIDRKQNETI